MITRNLWIYFILILVIIVGCNFERANLSVTPLKPTPIAASTVSIPTVAPSPTSTLTPQPTSTFPPPATVTNTPPLPTPELQPISVENVSQLRQLAEVKEAIAEKITRSHREFTVIGEVNFINEKLFIEYLNQTSVWQWDKTTRQLSLSRTLPTQNLVAISPDGKTLATENDQDFSIQLWDTNTGQQLRQLEREIYPLRGQRTFTSTLGLAFSPDGKILAVSDSRESIGERANYIRLWDIETGQLLGQRKVSDTFQFFLSVEEFLTQDTILTSYTGSWGCHAGGDSHLELWKVNDILSTEAQTPQWSTTGGPCCPERITSSLNRKVMAAPFQVCEKAFALVWDTETGVTRTWFDEGKPTYEVDIQALALNPTGTIVAASKSGGVFGLWRTDTTKLGHVRGQSTPNPLHLFSSKEGATLHITSLAYNRDGRLLVAGTGEGYIQLWDATTYQLLRTLEGPKGTVFRIEFSRDNDLLISKSEGSVRLWGIPIP